MSQNKCIHHTHTYFFIILNHNLFHINLLRMFQGKNTHGLMTEQSSKKSRILILQKTNDNSPTWQIWWLEKLND